MVREGAARHRPKSEAKRKRTSKQALHAVGVGADQRRDFAAGVMRCSMRRKRHVVAQLVQLHVLANLQRQSAQRAGEQEEIVEPFRRTALRQQIHHRRRELCGCPSAKACADDEEGHAEKAGNY